MRHDGLLLMIAGKVYGLPHVLVWEGFDLDDHVPEYTIEHPGCDQTDMGGYDDYDCHVAFELRNVGITDLLDLDDKPPGRYQFRGWTELLRVFEGTEYDAGFEFTEPAS